VKDYSWFRSEVLELCGIDLDLYKEKQMKRRIDVLIARNKLVGYESFVHMLQTNSDALANFQNYITINVTEFFRNADHWQKLESEVMPSLDGARIWSVACSRGQEAYSLVMSMAEHVALSDIHVLATDINEPVLKYAREGIYTKEEMKSVPVEYRERYFCKVDKGYRVCDEVRRCVEFRRMNLLADEFPRDFNLIVCRNVLIYFTKEAKDKLYPAFCESLKLGGVIFTGHTEQLLYHKQLGLTKISGYLYRKEKG